MSIQIVKQKKGWQVIRYGVPDSHLYVTKRVALEQIARMGEMNEYRRSQGQVAFGPGKRSNPTPTLGKIQAEKTPSGTSYRVWLGSNWSIKGTKAWAMAIAKELKIKRSNPSNKNLIQVVAKKDKWGYEIISVPPAMGGPYIVRDAWKSFRGAANSLEEAKTLRRSISGPARTNPSLRKSPHLFHGDDEHEMRREHRSKSRRHIAKHGRGAMFPISSTEGQIIYPKGLKALKASSKVKQMVGIKRKTQSILNNPGYYAGRP